MDERLEEYEQLWSEGYMKFVPDLLEYARNLENKAQELEEEIERTENSFANAYMQYQKQYERVRELEKQSQCYEQHLENKEAGTRIKVIRNELGLTMKEFGEKIDPPASDSIVSRWERGVSLPNEKRMKIIAKLGNVSMLYLITGQKDLKEENKRYKEALENTDERFEKMKKEFAEDIDFKRREVVELKKAVAGWAKQYEDLQEVNQRYKEALEFYADEKNYVRPYDNENFFDYLPSEMDFDKGERARKELKGEST